MIMVMVQLSFQISFHSSDSLQHRTILFQLSNLPSSQFIIISLPFLPQDDFFFSIISIQRQIFAMPFNSVWTSIIPLKQTAVLNFKAMNSLFSVLNYKIRLSILKHPQTLQTEIFYQNFFNSTTSLKTLNFNLQKSPTIISTISMQHLMNSVCSSIFIGGYIQAKANRNILINLKQQVDFSCPIIQIQLMVLVIKSAKMNLMDVFTDRFSDKAQNVALNQRRSYPSELILLQSTILSFQSFLGMLISNILINIQDDSSYVTKISLFQTSKETCVKFLSIFRYNCQTAFLQPFQPRCYLICPINFYSVLANSTFSQNTCYRCQPTCLQCAIQSHRCISCRTPYFLSDSNSCQLCIWPCKQCQSNMNCLSCVKDYKLQNKICSPCELPSCQKCPLGNYIYQKQICKKCIINCLKCNNPITCNLCNHLSYLDNKLVCRVSIKNATISEYSQQSYCQWPLSQKDHQCILPDQFNNAEISQLTKSKAQVQKYTRYLSLLLTFSFSTGLSYLFESSFNFLLIVRSAIMSTDKFRDCFYISFNLIAINKIISFESFQFLIEKVQALIKQIRPIQNDKRNDPLINPQGKLIFSSALSLVLGGIINILKSIIVKSAKRFCCSSGKKERLGKYIWKNLKVFLRSINLFYTNSLIEQLFNLTFDLLNFLGILLGLVVFFFIMFQTLKFLIKKRSIKTLYFHFQLFYLSFFCNRSDSFIVFNLVLNTIIIVYLFFKLKTEKQIPSKILMTLITNLYLLSVLLNHKFRPLIYTAMALLAFNLLYQAIKAIKFILRTIYRKIVKLNSIFYQSFIKQTKEFGKVVRKSKRLVVIP